MPEAVWAEFDSGERMARALHELRARGHTDLEAFSPCAVEAAAGELPARTRLGPLPLPPLPLPWVALAAGSFGALAGYLVQWFANAWAYPQNAGGRPTNAVPAFVFNTFESIVLVGGCAVFFALLVLLGLPRLWNPLEALDGFTRTSDDRFGILVADPPPWLAAEATEQLLGELGAASVRRVELP